LIFNVINIQKYIDVNASEV